MKARRGSGIVKKNRIEEELIRPERKKMLNIQLLVIRSLPYASSSSECAKGKVYNEKIQFVQTIIQNINTIRTFVIDFLHRSKQRRHVRKQTRLGATSIDPCALKN
jgi:hypothetical protein